MPVKDTAKMNRNQLLAYIQGLRGMIRTLQEAERKRIDEAN